MSSVLLSKRSYDGLGKSGLSIAKSYEPLEFYMTFIGGLGLWGASGTGLVALKLTYFGFYLFSFLLGQWFSIDTIHVILYTNDAIFNVAVWTVMNSKLKVIIHSNSLICLISRR